jgi:uncharacterized protein involved in type VI secretion and phage assembly
VDLEKAVANLVQKVEHRFYGKYRGLVVDNADPEQLGRLKLRVPSVLGNDIVTGWATACVPYGGDANQGMLFIPEIGAGVWVEFEEGDLEFPIWVGTFWSKPGGASELPKPNNADGTEQGSVQDPPTRKIIKTKKGHTIQLEDADGEEMITIIEATNGHVITMNQDGITITDGANGNAIIMGSTGIQIGSSGAMEPFLLGNQFMANVSSFLTALNAHTHTGNLGAPTSPPVAPVQLQVPLSAKHTVE